ncbi:uncharacterized protein LOC121736197 [Aricia agestis]|uniref:uncharacterized protein LOC121736197 n=1 Tax=Aricia agestis TaxID=91739 RepID=UPI001C204085|nr:uncharacterized protein LOC121736197 [Aricia agestis]
MKEEEEAKEEDIIVWPSESQLIIEGTTTKSSTFVNNGAAHLFQDIRYELNGVEIDRTKNCGVTTTMKGILSYGEEESKALENSCWNTSSSSGIKDIEGEFCFTIPLRHLLGFAEDYTKVIVNAKHELVLNRSSTNSNCAIKTKDATKGFEININRIVWRMPIVKVSDKEKLRLLRYVESNAPIPISFRSWDLYEYPLLPTSQKHVWTVKTSTQLEKPRFVILGFQHARNNDESKDKSLFDHSNFHNARLYLNSQYYPYESFANDFEKGVYSLLYEAFCNFKRQYYGLKNANVQVNPAHFKTKAPLVVIDCSRQMDTIRSGVGGGIDIKLEMEFKKAIPSDTTAYCLIINDSLFEYTILTKSVRKISS